MISEFKKWTGSEGFTAIDRVFADFLLQLAAMPGNEPLWLAGALVSRAVRLGHSCFSLALAAGSRFPDAETEGAVELPPFDAWRAALPERVCSFERAGEQPLVLDGAGRLYLQRYYQFEERLAESIRERADMMPEIPFLLEGRLAGLHRFFGAAAEQEAVDWQQLAVWSALANRLQVISGGPGTGKTTVVAALLALELERDPDLQICLCAPTGKAQARLQESLLESVEECRTSPGIKEKIRHLHCSTIHALLRVQHGSNEFYYNRDNPLPCDLLVVDECSMVSLPLMARLLPAMPVSGRIVLLGDRNQLASVEAGSVMADICDAGAPNVLPPLAVAAFRDATGWQVGAVADQRPLSGAIVELHKNHRFASAQHIGIAASAIRDLADDGAAGLARELATWDHPDFRVGDSEDDAALEVEIGELLKKHDFHRLPRLAAEGGEENLAAAFELLHSFRILAALHNGPRGVDALNRIVREKLRLTQHYAPGLALMIGVNDRRTHLFNGDVGLVWRARSGDGVRVRFPGNEREYLTGELPPHGPVFAMTVHKSQGSGFGTVLLVLPRSDAPILTRELLYTGITRAEKCVVLWGSAEVLEAALRRRTLRDSGLLDKLVRFFPGERL